MVSKSKVNQRVPMPGPWLASFDRGALVAIVVGTFLVFWTSMNDVYVMPKVVILGIGLAALVGLQLWSLGGSGVIRVPRTPAAMLVLAVFGVMALSTVVHAHRMVSIVGEYGRGGGVLTYAAAVAVFLVALVDTDPRSWPNLLLWIAGAAGLVIFYGLLQGFGLEPFSAPSNGEVLGTLGQLNFMAGFAGIVLPLFLWAAASVTRPVGLRLGAAALAVATVVVAANTKSFQAVVGVAAGAFIFALAWALGRWPARRLAAGLGAGLVVVLLGSAVAHSTIEDQLRNGLGERVLMWQTGRDIVKDNPILGAGPSGFAADFSTYRPQEHAVKYGTYQLVDAPHDVPLAMFVSGGGILGLLYLAFVGYVGLVLVRGLRATEGDRRLLLGAVGAAWVAYQAQSLVSIDVPVLILCHFLFAAAVVAVAGPVDIRMLKVRGLAPRQDRRHAVASGGGRVVQAAGVLLALAAVVFVFRMAVADTAFAHGLDARASSDDAGALDQFERSTSLAGWYGTYWAQEAAVLAAMGDQDRALVAGIKAAEKQPSAVSYALSTAQLAGRMKRNDVAEHYFNFALRHSPRAPDAWRAMAEYLIGTDRPARAVRYIEHSIELRPTYMPDRLLRAQALEQAGERAKAHAAYQSILDITPEDYTAVEGLSRTS